MLCICLCPRALLAAGCTASFQEPPASLWVPWAFPASPLPEPMASVCLSAGDAGQAAASSPPSEGAPLLQRALVAQTPPLFPAAESCQPWLPSQKAAQVGNISSYCPGPGDGELSSAGLGRGDQGDAACSKGGLEKGAQGRGEICKALNYAPLTKNNGGACSSCDIGVVLPACPRGWLCHFVPSKD